MFMRLAFVFLLAGAAWAQQSVPSKPCPRPVPGSSLKAPAELRSASGRLEVTFFMRMRVDIYGVTLYCYEDASGNESPTLRVHPGDEVLLHLKNELPATAGGHQHAANPQKSQPVDCGGGLINSSSTNLHFHGINIPPVCHQDDVLKAIVQPGDAPFDYRFRVPEDQPSGLYWYHPHPHGYSQPQVLGGASGALIVEGIEKANPAVAGLPERVLIVRDQPIGGVPDEANNPNEGDTAPPPSLDVSLNYGAVMYPFYKPVPILVKPQQKEFWRVLNASADTFFNLQLLFWPDKDSQRLQTMRVIAIDGAPVGEVYATQDRTSILLPPGARVEFIMTTPPEGLFKAQFLTTKYDNGPMGDRDSYRVLANLLSYRDSPEPPGRMPSATNGIATAFHGLDGVKPVRERKLYFSEKVDDPQHPKTSTSYFLTEEGSEPKKFDMNTAKPDITVTQGTVEDWTIENRANESHVFHIHQLHFQLLGRDGKPVSEPVLRDTIELPFWDGKSAYPSVKLRLDFRSSSTIGRFIYHCHILEHEDGGMMGTIEVVKRSR
jgi:FtsP/CotA-like multicopper oxidase with cupredoxin domain